jgi:hypothetical protein
MMLQMGRVGRRTAGLVAAVAAGTVAIALMATPAAGTLGTVTPRASDSGTASGSASAAATSTATAVSTATATPTATSDPSASATATPSPTVTTPTPDATATATPSAEPAPAPPPPLPTELGSWCTTLFPPQRTSIEREKAQAIMGGKATMSQGGTYRITEHPNWKPQGSTDTSGDRHVHSLNWALPLLYRGVHKQVPSLVERFRQLMHYWIEDHRGKRSYWVNASIYGGLRTQTLVCAAQTLNDPVIAEAALKDARTMVARNWATREVASGTNNTDLIRQTGALAAFCWTGDTGLRDRAWANLVSVARGVVHEDGSDVEGSPKYAVYIEKLLSDVIAAAATCGIPADPIPELRGRLYDFVAQAVRPDFALESLGDTINESLRGAFGTSDSRADWVRSAGTTGTPPAPIYTSYSGGYVFGRAGWQPQPGMADTFYSLRFSNAGPTTPHAHDDGLGVTLYSRGVEWIGDPGPYRYENSSPLRWFVKSRNAHSSVTVSNAGRTKSRGVRQTLAQSDWATGGNDTTCLRDGTWGSVTVTRCTQYIRSVDAIVVTDSISADRLKGKRKPVRVVTQRWQLPPGLSASNTSDVLTLASGDKALDIVKSGEGGWTARTARKGSSIGWFTGGWGEKLPGAVLSRAVKLPKAASSTVLVTVFVPRNPGDSTSAVVGPEGVTITRNGLTITTPLPTGG